MKLKFLLLIAVLAMVGGSVIVILKPARQSHKKIAPPEGELPTAMSNYSRTFKLNTTPPIWGQPTNGNPTR
jgi:hypothetical protein